MPDSSSFHPCGTNAPNFGTSSEPTMTLVSVFRVDDLDVRVFATEKQLADAAAADAAATIRAAGENRGHGNAMFATGNSQFAFLDALTGRDDVPWEHLT